MPSFHQQISALSLSAVHSAVDVFLLHSHWFCALAENYLGVQLSPQLTVSLVAVIPDESPALGGSCEERNFFRLYYSKGNVLSTNKHKMLNKT